MVWARLNSASPVAVPGAESVGILFSEPDEKRPDLTRLHRYELQRDPETPTRFT